MMSSTPRERPKGHVTISSLSKRLSVTPRTLRYYEAIGLITSERARRQGRLYNAQTVLALETIVLLRQADVPVAEIRVIMQDRDDPDRFLEKMRASLTAVLRAKQEAVAFVDGLLARLGPVAP